MTSQATSTSPASQPAPHRNRVSRLTLCLGVGAAPVAWVVQLMLGSGLASHACYPGDVPLAAPIWGNLRMVLVVINVIAIIVALGAGLIAWRNWRRTRQERPGAAHHLLESGDGATRFLAMCGMLTSALFLVAVVFVTGMLVVVPLCNG